MAMNWFAFLLMTLFNAAVCVLLPRIVTFNWSEAMNRFFSDNREGIKAEIVGENIPPA